MPFRNGRDHLTDLLISIDRILEFTSAMTHEHFVADRKTQAATERELQIIAEAAYRLGEHAEDLCPGADWAKIRGPGKVLRHGYHALVLDRIWTVASEDVPTLRPIVETALQALQAA